MLYTLTPFDTDRFDFVGEIEDLFDTVNLSDLHEDHKELFQVGMDSATGFHQKFYDKYREGWHEMVGLYESFIAQVVAPMFDEDILYQAFPTFRIHLRSNLAVGAFHTDAEFGHPKFERNFIIPLTNSDGTASVWVENAVGSEQYSPIKMQVGNLIEFDGNNLRHGNRINLTSHTRCSMDFRVLPLSKYDEGNATESVTRKTKFKENEYYKRYRNNFSID